MKPTFVINKLAAQNKSKNFDEFITKKVLDDICDKLIHSKDYKIIWKNARNNGRLLTLETDENKYFITCSQLGQIKSRNYYFQSVPTALNFYINEKKSINKECKFYFYFLKFSGNNKTKYMKFIYRLMKTAGINFLNSYYGLGNLNINPFDSVKEIINERNRNRSGNTHNKSTYITDEGKCYHIYGKTFGANQKETTLLCIGLSAVADKPIKLFQIFDNNSKHLSKSDKSSIRLYSSSLSKEFLIIDEVKHIICENTKRYDEDDLRNPEFIYNLLSKYHGMKKCVLCGCEIGNLVQGAHIYPISEIKKRDDLSIEQKYKLATDGDNGIFLCTNHHKLFDSGLIWFEEGKLVLSPELKGQELAYVKEITLIDEIDPIYINDRMLSYFDLRYEKNPRLNLS